MSQPVVHQVKWALAAEITVRGEEGGGGTDFVIMRTYFFIKKIL